METRAGSTLKVRTYGLDWAEVFETIYTGLAYYMPLDVAYFCYLGQCDISLSIATRGEEELKTEAQAG